MGGVASYKLLPVFTCSNGYWEVYGRFKGDFFGLGGRFEGGGVTWEDLSIENFVMGEETFNEGGPECLALLKKNNEKINMKSFFLLKVRSSIKT